MYDLQVYGEWGDVYMYLCVVCVTAWVKGKEFFPIFVFTQMYIYICSAIFKCVICVVKVMMITQSCSQCNLTFKKKKEFLSEKDSMKIMLMSKVVTVISANVDF